MKEFRDRINELISQLDEGAASMIHSLSTPGSAGKGGHLLRMGDVCKSSYLIVNGVARKYYLNEGKDITTEFYFPGDLAISLCSYTLKQPSREYIQAITDLDFIETDSDTFQRAKTMYPQLHEFDVRITELYAMWLEERLYQFHTKSATDRYIDLLESDPNIIQHVPLTHIASYLGVSLETLSRIRAKI